MKTKWVLFTKRTNDPKLCYIERRLDADGIKHRRNGESFHAPILEIQEKDLEAAWKIMNERHGSKRRRLDDIPDDHAMFC